MMAEMTTGTMVGHLAGRCLGTYDLPIPREGDRILLIAPTLTLLEKIGVFPKKILKLWICLHEVTLHTILGIPHVRQNLSGLLKLGMLKVLVKTLQLSKIGLVI